jgi:protein involved in polysaccharide export with SLBB domain
MSSLFYSSLLFSGIAASLVLPSVFAPVAIAQNRVPIFPGAAKPVAESSRYLIGPDDVLSVTVLRHPEFSAPSITVPGTGLIELPVVGNMRVAGRTAADVDAEITRKLKVRLLRPEVVVSIVKPAPRPIYVVGQVKNPSVLEFKNGWRITQALAASGGLSIDSDLAAVVVSRGKTMVADVALLPILKNPANSQNIALRIGDTLRFYERVVRVNVSGAVARPGIYAVPRGNGVVEAVGLAGGPTESASLTRASLRRSNGTSISINLFEALRQGKSAQNLILREGDVLSIPEYKDRVSLLGAVKNPGYYGLEDGRELKIADLIARAGGPVNGAALTRATLRHGDGKVESLNLYRLLVLGENDNNLPLGPNDVLTIPESRGITVIGEVQKPGTYKVEEGTSPRISDALALAGGLGTTLKPERARISVARSLPGGKTVSLSVDAVGLLELSSPAQNTLMQDGDIVSVSAIKTATVFVNGQVKTPGAYELKEGDGLAGLIARAGGTTDDAALSRVSITERGGAETKIVDAVSILRDGRGVGFALRDGDSVVIPRNENRILVVGAVTRPGSYAVAEDRAINVGDALSLAGGAQNGSRAKEIVLLRTSDKGVQRRTFRMDRAQDGQLAFVEPVRQGDVIYVPEGKVSQSTLGLVSQFLPTAAALLFR